MNVPSLVAFLWITLILLVSFQRPAVEDGQSLGNGARRDRVTQGADTVRPHRPGGDGAHIQQPTQAAAAAVQAQPR